MLKLLLMPLLLVLLISGDALAIDPEIFVSPSGSDTTAGTFSQPLATIGAARDRLRGRTPGTEAVIRLLPGDYLQRDTLQFTGADSYLTVCSAEQTKARIVGGIRFPASAFHVVIDESVLARCDAGTRGKLLQLDLSGLHVKNTGPYPDLFIGNGGLIDLYFDGRRMPLSRWPKDHAYTTMANVLDSGIVPQPHGGIFSYNGNRPTRWKSALDHGGVWLCGFWRVPWVCQTVKLRSIDAGAKTVTFAAAVAGGIGSKYSNVVNGTRVGDGTEAWYATNLLEEIDRPGEWCVDFSSRRLYWFPPPNFAPDIAGGSVVIADSTAPVIELKDASHMTLQRFDLFGGLGDGIRLQDTSDSAVQGVHVQSAGIDGIHITGGTGNTVHSCDVTNTGGIGIAVAGGDRMNLEPSHDQILNNHVFLTGRTDRSVYAIDIAGVGVRVAGNLIHDTPLGGVYYAGNDHVMELNELHNLGLEGGDLGGFYVNGDWAGRNNLVRYNLVHHSPNANGVYFDDGRSGDLAIENIFYRIRCGPFFSGGHDNVAKDNIILDCTIGLHLDDRGRFRNYTRASKGPLTQTLNELNLATAPWNSRYPAMLSMLADPDRLPYPTGNELTDNLLINVHDPLNLPPHPEQVMHDNRIEHNAQLSESDRDEFADPEHLNFAAAVNAHLPRANIPLQQIGLHIDEFRPTLPSDQETGRFTIHPQRTLFNSETDVSRSNSLGSKKNQTP